MSVLPTPPDRDTVLEDIGPVLDGFDGLTALINDRIHNGSESDRNLILALFLHSQAKEYLQAIANQLRSGDDTQKERIALSLDAAEVTQLLHKTKTFEETQPLSHNPDKVIPSSTRKVWASNTEIHELLSCALERARV